MLNSQDEPSTGNPAKFTHALFIDSTWNQSNGILKNPIISGLSIYK